MDVSEGSSGLVRFTQAITSWMNEVMQRWSLRAVSQSEMKLIETLALGGKRQLQLVSCDGERFIVGGGVDCIHSIVRLNATGTSECELQFKSGGGR